MSYCINPFCSQRRNPEYALTCLGCGTPLLINERISLVKPIKGFDDPSSYVEVFEVDDAGTEWNPGYKRRIMKILKRSSPKRRELIERESLTLQRIRHPNVPKSTIDDFFSIIPSNTSEELHCLVMDKVEGQDLEKWITSNGSVSQSLALQWLQQLVEILDVVHRSNFFHRDIKPANIMLQPNGKLALVDFGAARQVSDTYLAKVSGSGGTAQGKGGKYEITAVATPGYTPLEQINGQAVPQSDFYALGRTVVNLVTATRLVDLPTDKQTGNLIWRDKAPQIDKPFGDLLDDLMSPFPGQRPMTTRIILQRLERLPLQSKINRVVKSKFFKISAIAVFVSTVWGLYNVSSPAIADYLVNEGRKAQQQNRFEDAQNKFRQAVNIEPSTADSISKFYVEQGNQRNLAPEDARKYYELAIKFNSKNDTAYNNLGLLCQQLQDFKCVNDSYAAVFKLKPDKWESRYGLGSFYDDMGKYKLAEEQYKLAIKSSILALDAVSNLARVKILQGEYDEAINTALQGLKKAEEDKLKAALYKSIGWAKLEQHKHSEAKKYLEKALELDAQRTDTYCLLAKTQEALENFDKAWAWWEPCILLDSNLPEVVQWKTEILERIKMVKGYKRKNVD